MNFDEVERFALKDRYNDKIYETDYTLNGYKVYSVHPKDEHTIGIDGLPVYILANDDGDIRYASGKEIIQILEMLPR